MLLASWTVNPPDIFGNSCSSFMNAGSDGGIEGFAVKVVLHDGLQIGLFEVGFAKSFRGIHC